MGALVDWFRGPVTEVAASAPRTQPYWNSPRRSFFTEPSTAEAWPVGMARDQAMSVPAFRQGVTTIAGTCGTFPLVAFKAGFKVAELPAFLAQPDPDEPPSITWTRIVSDLVLFPYAFLRLFDFKNAAGEIILPKRDSAGFPRCAYVMPADRVSIDPQGSTIRYDGTEIDPSDVIRFDSPTAPGALYDGDRILRTALMIEDATRRFASMEIPPGYLEQTDGPEWLPEEITTLLGDWQHARRSRATAFVPRGLTFKTPVFNPGQLQLVEARNANAVDIARLLNLPPMSVNADTGASLTYSTTESQGQQLINTSLSAYLVAVAGRLSMRDVTPRGTFVRHDMTQLLRGDFNARMTGYATAKTAGVMTTAEIRYLEGLDPTVTPDPLAAETTGPASETNGAA